MPSSVLPEAQPLDVYVLPVTGDASAGAVSAVRETARATAPAAPASATVAAGSSAAAAAAAQSWSLRVVRPAAGVHLAGQRIVVMPEGNRVSVYQGAGWSDPAPVLVRDRVLEAFRADGRVGALSSDERQLHADFELDSDLRAFQSEYRGGRPEAVLRLDARLVHTASRRIVSTLRMGSVPEHIWTAAIVTGIGILLRQPEARRVRRRGPAHAGRRSHRHGGRR